jgi:hypothetical protein
LASITLYNVAYRLSLGTRLLLSTLAYYWLPQCRLALTILYILASHVFQLCLLTVVWVFRARYPPSYFLLNMYTLDEWPLLPDGTAFDGKQLLALASSDSSPFKGTWDVNLFFKEVQEVLESEVVDIIVISKGSNNYVSTCRQSLILSS